MKKQLLFLVVMIYTSFSGGYAQQASSFKQPYELGEELSPNPNFSGQVWLSRISKEPSLNVPMANVTFAPGCRNSWHKHEGGQLLIVTAGIGYYQEKGKTARRLLPGDIVEIPADVVHWHGADPNSWFAHIAISCNPQANAVTWLEPVIDADYFSSTAQLSNRYAEANQVLTAREQALVAVASYTGKGDLEHLPIALTEALEAGMSINEINELFIHAYAYCGFPRSLRAIQTFMELISMRKEQGIEDKMGREASPISDKESRYERGRDILSEISGIPAAANQVGYARFAPTIERFLKEHLFADLFERDLLTYRERELATLSILAGVGGVEPMVRSHFKISMHLGITPAQLSALLNIVEVNLGESYTITLREVLKQVTEE